MWSVYAWHLHITLREASKCSQNGAGLSKHWQQKAYRKAPWAASWDTRGLAKPVWVLSCLVLGDTQQQQCCHRHCLLQLPLGCCHLPGQRHYQMPIWWLHSSLGALLGICALGLTYDSSISSDLYVLGQVVRFKSYKVRHAGWLRFYAHVALHCFGTC